MCFVEIEKKTNPNDQKFVILQTERTDLWLPRVAGVGEGWIGNLRLASANYYT